MQRCPICLTIVQSGGTECPACRQEYHAACWESIGGCAIWGCSEAAELDKPTMSRAIGAGWGDEKTCPACEDTIWSSALICNCGAKFPYAEPMTPDGYRAWKEKQEGLASKKTTLTVLFIISLLGLPAPLTGTIAGIVAYRNRERLAGANGTYLAMGFSSAALGAFYAVVAGLIALGL